MPRRCSKALAVIGAVIPGSSIVFIGGVLIGLKALDPWWTAAVAVTGAILGDGISYWLGHHYHERIRAVWPMKKLPAIVRSRTRVFRQKRRQERFSRSFSRAGAGHRSGRRWNVEYAAGAVLRNERPFGICLGRSPHSSRRAFRRFASACGRGELATGRHAGHAIVVVLWAISKLVRFAFSHGWPRIKLLRDRAVERARGKSGLLARIVLSLFDPARAESQALLTAAVLLIGSAWLFLGILEDVVSNDPLVQLDQTIYTLLQGLRTEWADNVMVAVTELGGAAGTVPVIIAVSLLLVLVKRYWHTFGYWLAAVAFAEILVWVLKYTLGRARPNNIYTGVEQFSFPSGHAALSIVVYGFMAFLLARGKPIRKPRSRSRCWPLW